MQTLLTWLAGTLATRTRRAIARACICICAAATAAAAIAFTVAPHRFPFSAVLRTDVPAIISIIAARVYLYSTRRRS